jgi:hypothetical protein
VTDVVVYGATAAGVTAAAAAVHVGLRSSSSGPNEHVGGMVSGA